MKENLYSKVVEKTLGRMNSATNSVAQNFKNVNPFGQVEIPKGNLLSAYKQLGTQDVEYLLAKHGRDKLNSFISDMETLNRR